MSQNQNDQQEEQLVIPRRGLIIRLLIAGLAIFWLAVLAGKSDFGCSPEKAKKSQPSRPENRSLPHRGANSEITRQSDGSWLVKWTGEGERGFRLPDLAPGRYRIGLVEGRIVYTSAGDSFPVWGTTGNYPDEFQRKFRYRLVGIRNNQVLVVIGQVGSGSEKLVPFLPGENLIIFQINDLDNQGAYLFYHYIVGLYDQFGWDGSYAVFRLERLD